VRYAGWRQTMQHSHQMTNMHDKTLMASPLATLFQTVKALPGIGRVAQPLWHLTMRAYISSSSRALDFRYRIKTYIPANKFERAFQIDSTGIDPMKYSGIRRVMREIPVTENEVFFDIGCGTGRVVCMFSRIQMEKCVGIEYMPQLAAAAQTNAQRVLGRKTTLEIRNGDAAAEDYTGGTLFFFFNPFGEKTMRLVIDRILQSLIVSPRPIRLVYVKPEQDHILRECGWLECMSVFGVRHKPGRILSTSVWRNIRYRDISPRG
jgi:hypothetical protein